MKILAALFLVAALGLAALAGCIVAIGGGDWYDAHVLHGNGDQVGELRELPPFRRIELRGSSDLDVQVGGAQSVEVRADSNLIELVTTEVRGDLLVISMQPGRYSFQRGPELVVHVPALDALDIHGSADASVTGVQGEHFRAAVSGSGDISATGRVDHLEARVSGSGDLRLGGLEARTADVRVSGSGDIRVDVRERLEAHVSGSGDIAYTGSPAKDVHVSGSGSVRRK